MRIFERHHHGDPGNLATRALYVGACFLATACSSAATNEPETGPCTERSGSYVFRLTQRSGTCGNDGDVAEGVVNFDATTLQVASDTCSGEATASTDNCSVQYTIRCKRDDLGAGWMVAETGKSNWNRTGSQGSATEQLTIFRGNGIQECSSLADMTWTRQ